MLDLTSRDEDRRLDSCAADLAPVERIAARRCLGVDALEVGTDCRSRRSLSAKPLELRVTSITPSLSAKHGSSQQRFSPQCDKALWIEIPRMQ